ncbi:nitroreductase family protein [Caulobacter hibisci]|uniref:Nitroreductase family protein n=1 Tax=Caulobacter hibisci TaxID=2035993 RepID=A0ABS0SU09_9CAUL|nr:nitroreductase family protein [Caulobacter hibisci]MBI1682874.1 nitroreductase family protein [Caulobacter hibisci]
MPASLARQPTDHPLLSARYGQSAPAIGALLNPTIEGLLAHRSVRAYLPDPLAEGVVETLVASAQSAATSSNLQLWSVVAVEDPERKARLADLAGGQAHIRQAPLLLVWLADLARAERITRQAGQGKEALDYLESFLVAAVDAALAAQAAVAALESLGLGSVYIGALRNRPEAVAAELGLPPLVLPVFGLVVGHPDPAAPAAIKPRLSQAAVLHRETYDLAAQDAPVRAYDETLGAFQTSQGLAATGWSAAIVNRVGNAKALNGRERLRQALEGFGFPLR